jgi:hypothetical protein
MHQLAAIALASDKLGTAARYRISRGRRAAISSASVGIIIKANQTGVSQHSSDGGVLLPRALSAGSSPSAGASTAVARFVCTTPACPAGAAAKNRRAPSRQQSMTKLRALILPQFLLDDNLVPVTSPPIYGISINSDAVFNYKAVEICAEMNRGNKGIHVKIN